MKPKHIQARIDQCLRNAELSRCPRRKFGAMLLDAKTNSILADGYNGPPRGEEGLCGGWFCERDGVIPECLEITNQGEGLRYTNLATGKLIKVQFIGVAKLWIPHDPNRFTPGNIATKEDLVVFREMLIKSHPPIASGTHMEKGCHHAESNVIANACRRGTGTEGAWLIVTGEPCTMCAKLIHHAGIEKVFVVKGGYAGGDAGVVYLRQYGVEVEYVEGPQDPRSAK